MQRDGLPYGVDEGDFAHEVGVAEQRGDEARRGLAAGYEAFGTELGDVSKLLFQTQRGGGRGGGGSTMPVCGSTLRLTVSTATTWVLCVFHAQYLRQFAMETLAQG